MDNSALEGTTIFMWTVFSNKRKQDWLIPVLSIAQQVNTNFKDCTTG